MTLFYYEGKCFDNEEDFWKYAHEWPSLPFDEEAFKLFLDSKFREAKLNYEARGGRFTNLDAYRLLRLSTNWTEEKKNEGK